VQPLPSPQYQIGFIGPFVFEHCLTAEIYLNFFEDHLPELLKDVHLEVRQSIWLQHDVAPSHSARLRLFKPAV
jgi:hypothetical protein